mmetsp:Transcript_24074/g.50195  ORF Transcript_24074/g.50195 Transcript_24074/m.50195 type:complete len:209 (+) Transcript_24074:3542-4168(+)
MLCFGEGEHLGDVVVLNRHLAVGLSGVEIRDVLHSFNEVELKGAQAIGVRHGVIPHGCPLRSFLENVVKAPVAESRVGLVLEAGNKHNVSLVAKSVALSANAEFNLAVVVVQLSLTVWSDFVLFHAPLGHTLNQLDVCRLLCLLLGGVGFERKAGVAEKSVRGSGLLLLLPRREATNSRVASHELSIKNESMNGNIIVGHWERPIAVR